ncbi:MAG TPA: hypothetical protein ENH10_10685 [Bacteroidetes bacterium]|nr:hypothetical protein BMS3Bbin04_00738 [bacterium BMS3Bbin04]HDO66474.1 hypothetical protein [Bacteroidota bacterium]HEX05599.1 hypothetical protein [Bacteroidota bacterium]
MKRIPFGTWAMIAISILMLIPALVAAQPPPGNLDEQQTEVFRQRMEMMRIWKLTELLSLDEEKAAVFFPRYQKYLAQMDTLNSRALELDVLIERGLRGENVDYGELLDSSFELEEQRFKLSIELVKNSTDILNEQEQVALMLFERRYHQRLREMMNEIQHEQGPPGRPRRGWQDGPPKDSVGVTNPGSRGGRGR